MVQAILEGRKNQTRRIIKKQPHIAGEWIMQGISWLFPNVNPYIKLKCPYGQPGDIFWVRETWSKTDSGHIIYKATNKGFSPVWKPSIFMPKAACRIWLKVTDVRVERLQEITEEDAIAEGIEKYGPFGEYKGSKHPGGGMMKFGAYGKASRAYEDLWESINGNGSWKKNPWVWVIDFKQINKSDNENKN
jgi:hypothetical protein